MRTVALSSFKAFLDLVFDSFPYTYLFLCMHASVEVERQLAGLSSFFLSWGTGSQTRVVSFGNKCPSPLSTFEWTFVSYRRKIIFNKNFLSDLKY